MFIRSVLFCGKFLILSLSKPGDLLDNNMAIMMSAALNFEVETVLGSYTHIPLPPEFADCLIESIATFLFLTDQLSEDSETVT